MIVAMVATSFAGLDGVSLAAAKLATVLEEQGHAVVWFAGELGDRFRSAWCTRPLTSPTPTTAG